MRIERLQESFKEMPNFMPVSNARQTTEVFMQNNRLKMRINNATEQSASELVEEA